MSYRTHQKSILLKRGRNRLTRPKTFKTEEAANAYAKANNMEKYVLENIGNSSRKKIRIVQL